jgi:hypothetical protein
MTETRRHQGVFTMVERGHHPNAPSQLIMGLHKQHLVVISRSTMRSAGGGLQDRLVGREMHARTGKMLKFCCMLGIIWTASAQHPMALPPPYYPWFPIERVLGGRPRRSGDRHQKARHPRPMGLRGPRDAEGQRTRGRPPSMRRPQPVLSVATKEDRRFVTGVGGRRLGLRCNIF